MTSAQSHRLLRKLMEKEHNFLYKLYTEKSGRKNRKTLQNATKTQVWVVLRLLFCIAAGHIPLTLPNYRRLVQSRRRNTLRSLKNRMRSLRGRKKVSERRAFVKQFAVLYHFLFHDIFMTE